MAVESDILVRRLRKIPELSFQEELRGYSKHQVDMVLESLMPAADEIERLQGRVSEAETRAASAEARLMGAGAEEGVVFAPVEPATPPEVVSTEAIAATTPPTPAEFDETLRNTLLLAQRTADETVRHAREQADKVVADANAQAGRIVSDAESRSEQLLAEARTEAARLESEIASSREELRRDVDAERRRLLSEMHTDLDARRTVIEDELREAEGAERATLREQIADLQRTRTAMTTDIEALEGFLTQRRDALGTVASELSALVDDPGRLGQLSIPDVSDSDVSGSDVSGTAGAPTTGSASSAVSVTSAALSSVESELAGDSGSTGTVGEETEPADAEAADADTQPGDVEASDAESADAEPAEDELAEDKPAEDEPDEDAESVIADLRTDAEDRTDLPAFVEGDLESGPATEQVDVSSLQEDGPDLDLSDSATSEAPARPSWADAVPADEEAPAGQDPFLDQLRRATSDDGGPEDEALERFLESDGADERRSWFGRRR